MVERVAAALAVALGLAGALRYLTTAYPLIEGVDFFFYACVARDYLHGLADAPLSRYGYFPGGYRVLQFLMSLFGESLPALQLSVAGLLVANAVLSAAIVARCTTSLAAGAMAGFWTLMLATRFEALHGTTEPIATLFALAGVFAWAGLPLTGRQGWRRALLLAAGLGLATWTKQQGGLVAVGAAVLGLHFAMSRSGQRDSAWQVMTVPAAALAVFLVAVLLEGRGLEPLRIGLGLVGQYGAEGSLPANLPALAKQTGAAAWLVLIALFFWIVMLGSAFANGIRQEPWVMVVGFSLIAALATLLQFTKRPYFHYALLAAPFVAIAVTTMAARAAQAAVAAWPRFRPLVLLAAAGLLAAPVTATSGASGYFQAWPLDWDPRVAHGKPWHMAAGIAQDLESLSELVAKGEDMLVLPPRRNVFHFMLGTRSLSNPSGYGWGAPGVSRALESRSLGAVLVLDPHTFDDADKSTCRAVGCDEAVSALAANGFTQSTRLGSMTLWRRTPH